MTINDAPIDELVAAGKYLEAAEAALAAGEPLRAATLYERIWRFAEAAAAARAGGDLPRALRDALDARDQALCTDLLAELSASGAAGQRHAAEALASRRRFAEAAQLLEQTGDHDQAIRWYEQAGSWLDAGRLLELAGRDRDAGRHYERVLTQGDDPGATRAAQLRLGLLLAGRLQHDAAVRHLQEAARHEDTRRPALRALVVELAALGLRDAARDALQRARADDPSLPAEVEEMVRGERDARAPAKSGDTQLVGGRWRLLGEIGSGGAGRVFRARDEVTGRPVAVKVFQVAQQRDRDLYERFVREAKVTGGLHHANLVEVYDFSADLGILVMELMEGGSLAARLAAGPLSEPAVRRLALDLLAGLEAAHQRGVVHRDVKPANVFFDARGTAKLGDFGVAHLLDLGQTQTGGLIGTLAYMSPEQITGAAIGVAADLYGLGVTLFEALTGRLPFLGPDFVAQHLGEPAPLPGQINPELAAWDPIVDRLLRKDPGERYPSIDELRTAIAELPAATPGVRPLVLPRARPRARTAETSGSLPAQGEAGDEAPPRYQFETPLGRTAISDLARAVDAVLQRSVVIERFDEGTVDAELERRLMVMARGGGPYLQRVLSWDRGARTAVYEAPAGVPTGEAFIGRSLDARAAARLLGRLARALAPVHETGHAHGVVDALHVVIDELAMPTVLVAGLGAVAVEASPERDVAAVIGVVAAALGQPDATATDAVVEALLAELSPTERGGFLAQPRPRTGEELYAFAHAIEIALLKAERRAGRLA